MIEVSVSLAPTIALLFALTSCQKYLQGPIKAMGLLKKAAIFAFACYWLIAIPMCGVLSFWLDIGIIGLVGGTCIG